MARRDSSSKSGKKPGQREKRAAAARVRYQVHRADRIAQAQARYQLNREEILAWHRAHYAAHREEILAAKREHRQRNIERERLSDREYYAREKARIAREGIKRRYHSAGFTWKDYLALNEEQAGRCAICRRTPREAGMRSERLQVDHDHRTHDVRGLLCGSCNVGLAVLDRAADWLAKAHDYRNRYQAQQEATQ